MKAVVLTEYGDVDKLELREVPDPGPAPRDVRVRVAGAGINPIDWKIRSGAVRQRMPIELPAVLGRDAAGLVVEVGASVTTLKVGARVAGLVTQGYAEYVVAPADVWAELPPEMDLVEAGALPLVLLTGAQLIEEGVRPGSGDKVLVTGALGGVGRSAVFAAKERGSIVWAGVRGTQKAAAEQVGADSVVAIDDDSEVARLPTLDAIADTVGGETIARLLGKVRPQGVIGSVLGEPPGAKERGLVVRPIFAHPDSKRLGELLVAVARGRILIPIARKFPLAEARRAQQLAEKGAEGKVVLTV